MRLKYLLFLIPNWVFPCMIHLYITVSFNPILFPSSSILVAENVGMISDVLNSKYILLVHVTEKKNIN